ncbi:MAG: FHA domain-containing protein [Flavobacteriales bacterium]|nr:FHA domain-containing protein [Flavobacteriales bacterium]
MVKISLRLLVIIVLLISITGFANAKDGIQFQSISMEKALAKAEKENKLVFIDISTSWCAWCKHLTKNVFPDKELGEFMNEHFVSIKLDGEKGTGQELMSKYNLKGFPAMLFLSADDKMLEIIPGAVDAIQIMKVGEKAVAAIAVVQPDPMPVAPDTSKSNQNPVKPTPDPVKPTPNPVKPTPNPVKTKPTPVKGGTYTGPLLGLSPVDSMQLDSILNETSKRGSETRKEMEEISDKIDQGERKVLWYLIIIGGILLGGFILIFAFIKKKGTDHQATEVAQEIKSAPPEVKTVAKGALKDDSGIFGGGDFVVHGTLTVGRSDQSSLKFPATIKEVSRDHAILKQEGLYLFVTDLGSSNGTLVNDVRIKSNVAVQLHPGDKISFGKKRYGFTVI